MRPPRNFRGAGLGRRTRNPARGGSRRLQRRASPCSILQPRRQRPRPGLTRRREPWPPPGSHGQKRQHLDHRRGCTGRASFDPSCVARHSGLPHRGGVRRRLPYAPHRHRHRQRQAPVELAPLAPAGNAAQRALPAADRPDHRGRRRDDGRGRRRGGRGAGGGAYAAVGRDPDRDPARQRRVLRPQRHPVQISRRCAQRYGPADQGRALPRHACRRSDPARRPRRDLAIDRGRASRKDDPRRHEAGGDRDRRRPRRRRPRQASRLFLAPADHRPCAGALRASAVRQHPAGPQLRRFAAGRRGDQGDSSDDREIGADARQGRQGAPHWIGRAFGRGILDRRRRGGP